MSNPAQTVKEHYSRLRNFLGGVLFWICFLTAIAGTGFAGYRLFFVKAVDNHEYAFKYNWWTGVITKVEKPGWMTTVPLVIVGHTIDGRPQQVCMNANARVLNCKLVRFNPAGLDAFILAHGRSAGDDPHNLYEILKSYAFDGTDELPPFLFIDRKLELKATGR